MLLPPTECAFAEKLSLPIGIRAPPAAQTRGGRKRSTRGRCAAGGARSDNVLRKMRRASHTEQGRTTRAGIARRAGKINPRALRGGRERSTRGHCAAGGKDQPAGIARRAGRTNPRALCGKRERSAPAVPKFSSCAPLPRGAPFIAHADPAKEARADLPTGRVVVHASRGVPGRTKKKRSRSSVFLLSVYSLEPVSISEPMIIFWKIANRMMTGRTHMTAAAMTGPWF